jgi:hypothetical protein
MQAKMNSTRTLRPLRVPAGAVYRIPNRVAFKAGASKFENIELQPPDVSDPCHRG